MQALFQTDVSKNSIDKVLDILFEEENFVDDTKEFSKTLASGVLDNITEIDDVIKKYSTNWSFDRIVNVDKNILRIAIFELLFFKENPDSVVINEAIELAKKYSEDESAKFINGILGSVVSDKLKSVKS